MELTITVTTRKLKRGDILSMNTFPDDRRVITLHWNEQCLSTTVDAVVTGFILVCPDVKIHELGISMIRSPGTFEMF